jgi:purine nucleosidase
MAQARVRVISDNDYCGDPDGLVQLAHHLLCPSVDMRLVIGGQVASFDFSASPTSAYASRAAACEIAELTGRSDVRVLAGSNTGLDSSDAPRSTPAADAIVDEAMRDDTDAPLFVACGGSLTNIASAWLVEPRIAERLTLVWIGGGEYEGLAEPPPDALPVEYNTGIDVVAAQVVFNRSNVPIWQVPQDAYRQVLASRSELVLRMQRSGTLGAYLFDAIDRFIEQVESFGVRTGETYVLGDSPLVLLTALLSPFSPAPSSTRWATKPRPTMLDTGLYGPPTTGARIRVVTQVDTRLLLEDLYAKLGLRTQENGDS